MSKAEHPSLFHIASAVTHGFHAMQLRYSTPHFVRVILDREGITVEVMPNDLVAYARPYKPAQPTTEWRLCMWWDDPYFSRQLELAIQLHAQSLNEKAVLRFDKKNRLVIEEEKDSKVR